MKPTIPSALILALCFLSSIGLLLFPHPAAAVSVGARQWEMTADKLTRHENPPTIIAEGNVVLEKKEPVATTPPPKPSEWSNLLGDEPTTKTDADSTAKPATELKDRDHGQGHWVPTISLAAC